MDALSLIDVSGEEDDFLLDLASPPQHPDPPPPPRAAPGASAVAADAGSPPPTAGQAVDPAEQAPERAQSPKKAKPKGGVNLRKSLAWDKAFFTSEGVLDTEELGIVNSTFRKSHGSRLLPGIAEELRRSTESTTSTLDSESFVLESLETELFDNVRASIQRTLGKPDKAPGVASASSKTPRATAKAPPVTARKGVDRIPQAQSKIRPPASTSNGSVGGSKQRPQVTLKEPAAGRVAVSKAAEAKPSSKPPRALPRVATMRAPTNTAVTSGISDKRSSTGGVVNRQTIAKSANSSANVPSRPGGGTKNNSTSKSGALSSAASSSLHSAPMAGGKTKSPTLISKNRTTQRIPIRASSRSDIRKVDPARASRNKSHGEGASPIVSPSSSVDSMCSVISGVSTASTVGRASHTSETFSTRSSSLSPSTRKSNDHPLTTLPRPQIVAEGQASRTFSDNVKSDVNTSTQGNGFKPSGLRRPTPKIGYFDAEKSVEQKAGARAQLQPTKVLFSPLATQSSWIPSTPKTIPASLTFEQEEPKSRAAAPSQTKASPSLPLKVAQSELKPSKVTEPEASQAKASTPLHLTVSRIEVKQSKLTEPEASQAKASTPLPIKLDRTEVNPSKVTEHDASQTKALAAAMEVELLEVIEHAVEAPMVSEHGVQMLETGPLVAMDIAEEEGIPALNQNVQANGDISSSTVELSSCASGQQQSETTPAPCEESVSSQTKVSPSLPLGAAKMEVEPVNVTENEACTPQTSPVLAAMDIAKMEVEPVNVTENEACTPQTSPVLAAMDIAKENIPAVDTAKENVQPGGFPSPLKENILALHQNIQPKEHMTPVKGSIVASHTNVQAVGEMTPVSLLSQKLSSISLGQVTGEATPLTHNPSSISQGQSNGEATPLTLLAQKLSSISLRDATD
ncbi:endochitinase A-like [Hordeum vulgare]|nr:endochitinase A-like [Hordeum vulgare]